MYHLHLVLAKDFSNEYDGPNLGFVWKFEILEHTMYAYCSSLSRTDQCIRVASRLRAASLVDARRVKENSLR